MAIPLTLALTYFNFVGANAARVVLTLYALELGAPASSVGVLGGLLFLFPLLLSWPIGALADRTGARGILLFASCCGAASLVLMVGLYFFVEKTKMGKAMRACAENTQTARLLGVNVHWITIWTFGIASALAGAAGVLIGLAYNITPLMGGTLGLKGLTIMLFGGSGNIVGAMVAALVLGMIETMSVAYLVPAWKDGFAFGILILILLYKPSGLFGSRLQIEAGR